MTLTVGQIFALRDLVVAVELDEFPGGLAARDGWEQHPKREYEFRAPADVKLDILPAR